MRHQLPGHSPLSSRAIIGAASAARRGRLERSDLEAELADRFDAAAVILTDSGTAALQLALRSLHRGGSEGPVVALPGYSCYDMVTAAVGARVRARFYDVDPRTLAPDMDSLRDVLSRGAAAVVAGNLYGYPLAAAALRSEVDTAGVALIEDAAQGVGTVTDRGPGGTLGAATVLSFGRGKGWTGGGGGALLLRGRGTRWREEIEPHRSSVAAAAKAAAVSSVAWVLGRPGLYGIPTSIPGLGLGETRYREPTTPRTIPAFSAALVRRTAEAAAEAIGERRRRAVRLAEGIGERGLAGVRVCQPIGGVERASFLRLPVVVEDPQRARALARAGRRLGLAPGYPTALHRLPQSAPWGPPEGVAALPGSERLAASLLTLPTHDWVTDGDMSAILDFLERGA